MRVTFAHWLRRDSFELGEIDQEGIDVLLVADGLTAESEVIAKLARARHLLTAGNAIRFSSSLLKLATIIR